MPERPVLSLKKSAGVRAGLTPGQNFARVADVSEQIQKDDFSLSNDVMLWDRIWVNLSPLSGENKFKPFIIYGIYRRRDQSGAENIIALDLLSSRKSHENCPPSSNELLIWRRKEIGYLKAPSPVIIQHEKLYTLPYTAQYFKRDSIGHLPVEFICDVITRRVDSLLFYPSTQVINHAGDLGPDVSREGIGFDIPPTALQCLNAPDLRSCGNYARQDRWFGEPTAIEKIVAYVNAYGQVSRHRSGMGFQYPPYEAVNIAPLPFLDVHGSGVPPEAAPGAE